MDRTTRALVLEAPRRLALRELPLPEVGDDDALLRVEACGLCGTDHEQWSGALPAATPMIPGHETVGRIEAIGAAAAARFGVAAGDRVAVEVFQSCRRCERCRAGDVRGCRRHGLRDSMGQTPLSVPPGLWGGYAEHQYLGPDALVQRVPDGIEPAVACAFNPIAGGVRWGSVLPETGPGDVVAVLGPGIRGLAAAAACREAGADFVLVTGCGRRDAPRLAAAPRFGADLALDVAERDPVAALREACDGRLADVVVDLTANAPEAFPQALALAAPGARVVVAGTRGDVEIPGFRPDVIVAKELTLRGALGVDSADYRAALGILASGRYPFADLPRRTAGLADLEELLRTLAGESGEEPPVHGVLVP